jgi:hypothetical protein
MHFTDVVNPKGFAKIFVRKRKLVNEFIKLNLLKTRVKCYEKQTSRFILLIYNNMDTNEKIMSTGDLGRPSKLPNLRILYHNTLTLH